jgi:hypothetical protein
MTTPKEILDAAWARKKQARERIEEYRQIDVARSEIPATAEDVRSVLTAKLNTDYGDIEAVKAQQSADERVFAARAALERCHQYVSNLLGKLDDSTGVKELDAATQDIRKAMETCRTAIEVHRDIVFWRQP